MVSTNDGFEISEADLKLRGPGDIQGTRQSGMLDLKIANLAKDGELVGKTRKVAEAILAQDEYLSLPKNSLLNLQLREIRKGKQHWGKIS
jgi:ATP-dependent DNA helicase RecG